MPSGRRTPPPGATHARRASWRRRCATIPSSGRASTRSSRSSSAVSPSSTATRESERSASAGCRGRSTSSSRYARSRRRASGTNLVHAMDQVREFSDLHPLPVLRRGVQRLERARLADRIPPPEQQLRLPAGGGADVLELEAVRVLMLHIDRLDALRAAFLDVRLIAVPWVVQEERALAADRLDLVPLG